MKVLIVVFLCIHGGCLTRCLLGSFAVPPAGTKSRAVGRNTDRVKAMRPRNSCDIRNSRASAAVTRMPTRRGSLGGQIAVTKTVGESRWGHAVGLRRSIRALGR